MVRGGDWGDGRIEGKCIYLYIYSRGRKGPEYNTCARAGVREYRDGKRDGVVVSGVVAHARGPGPKASKDITIKNNVPHKSV